MDRDTFDKLVMILLALVLAALVGHFITFIPWYWVVLIQAVLSLLFLFAVFTLLELPRDLRRKRRTKRKAQELKTEEENFKKSIEHSLDPNLNYATKQELIRQALLKRDVRARIAELKDNINNAKATVEERTRYIAETETILKDYEDSLNEGVGGQV